MTEELADQAEGTQPARPKETRWTKIRAGVEALLFSSPRPIPEPEFDSLLRKFHEVAERSRLSLAALETLAIIAYRQPITLPEIQEIRGVNSASVVNTLFEKKLITTAGRKA